MRSTSWTIAAALSAALCACGGGSSDGGQGCTTAPITITPGIWCITITGTQNNCGSSVVPPPYAATFTQSGSDITATSLGATYTGTLCGASGAMTGTTSTASVAVDLAFQDASHATGTSYWTLKSSGCSGADTVTAHAGTCP